MNPTDYRREYNSYRRTLEREKYERHAGLPASAQGFEFIRERYADLWTRDAIDDLQKFLDEGAALFETERAALRSLVGVARAGHVEAGAREECDELARCESAARVGRDGESFAADEAPRRIADERDATRRRELCARWFDALGACDDLRAVRRELRRESARSLGFRDDGALHEHIEGITHEALAARAEAFLQQTAPAYYSHLARWSSRELPGEQSGGGGYQLNYSDGLFFRRMARFDAYFPARQLVATYGEAIGGLGIRVGTQNAVRLDAEARPFKKASPACFALAVPDEVLLVADTASSGGGAQLFKEFFRAAGRAQYFAWSSRETAARYPELIHAPDAATREGHAALFANLFLDARWLGEHRELREAEAHDAARACALVELHDARRDCARLRYFLALESSTDARSEQLAETYAATHTEATGFRHAPATALLGAGDAALASESLRARLFAAAMGEHLRSRHGHRWWSKRAAGDELIDVWNTASRYRVEELARLVGAGELDFDLLADKLTAALGARR